MNDHPTEETTPVYLSPDLSSDEVREARGLEPEQPKLVTPESLARRYAECALPQNRAIVANGFLAGYRANGERNVRCAGCKADMTEESPGYWICWECDVEEGRKAADLAQRLDLAQEALKRYGFERGVVNDVLTWERLGVMCENQGLVREIGLLRTSAVDYAKAAEASAALVEKLTLERDDARKVMHFQNAIDLAKERDSIKAASAAFKRYVHERLDKMGIPTDPESPHRAEGCRVGGRFDCVQAALEKAVHERNAALASEERMVQERETWRKEVAQLKQHLSNQCDCANRWEDAAERAEKKCDDLRRQLAEAETLAHYKDQTATTFMNQVRKLQDRVAEEEKMKVNNFQQLLASNHERDEALGQLAEWQAVAGKMREFVECASKRYGNMSTVGNIIEEARIFYADTSSATALIDALEGAWKEGRSSFSGVTGSELHRVWLASSTIAAERRPEREK